MLNWLNLCLPQKEKIKIVWVKTLETFSKIVLMNEGDHYVKLLYIDAVVVTMDRFKPGKSRVRWGNNLRVKGQIWGLWKYGAIKNSPFDGMLYEKWRLPGGGPWVKNMFTKCPNGITISLWVDLLLCPKHAKVVIDIISLHN